MARKITPKPGMLLILISLWILSSCGSGGGDGSPNSISYAGNIDPAVITKANAAKLAANLMGDTATAGNLGASRGTASAPSKRTNQAHLGRQLSQFVNGSLTRTALARAAELRTAARIEVDETETCDGENGATRTFGALNDDGTGALTVTFNNCRLGDETFNGQATLRVDAFSGFITESNLSFPALTMTSPSFNFSVSGSIRYRMTVGTNTETLTLNMVTRDNTNGGMTKAENLMLVYVYDDVLSPSSYSETISGRVYDSVHGYVDVTTLEALLFSDILTEYPDQGGQLLLTGASDSRAKIIAASIQKLRIEIDAEGNDSFDEYSVYYWTDIGGELASNEPPEIPTIGIQPNNPYTTDSLTVNTSMIWDPDADPLNYNYVWYKNGSTIPGQTSGILSADQHMKGDVIGVEVTVSDGVLTASNSDFITILNSTPVVGASTDITFMFGEEPTLEGSAIDADNDPLTYTWSIISQPFDGNAILSNSNLPNPTFTYTGQGVYTFELSVSDGESTLAKTFKSTIEPMPLFNPYVSIAVPSHTESLAIGDVNGDGVNDVIVTSSYAFDPNNDNHLFVLLQDPSGNLSAPIKYSVGLQQSLTQIQSTAIADMNNDGRDDVVISYENGVGVLLQNAQGSLEPITVYTSNLSDTYKLVAADFNGDGLNDVVSIGWGGEDVEVYLQNNSATLDPPVSYLAPHGGYDDLAHGDVNGDGLNDIVVMSGQSYSIDNLSILLQQSDNTFGAAVPYDLGVDVNSNAVAVGDVNGDGLDDVILAYGGNKPSSRIAIFYQNIFGTLDNPISLLSYDSPSAVEIADINGDGRNDIVVGHSGWMAVGIYLQKPDGTLMGEQRFPFTYSTNNPHRMAVGDINGDGQKDIVDASGSGITILYQ